MYVSQPWRSHARLTSVRKQISRLRSPCITRDLRRVPTWEVGNTVPNQHLCIVTGSVAIKPTWPERKGKSTALNIQSVIYKLWFSTGALSTNRLAIPYCTPVPAGLVYQWSVRFFIRAMHWYFISVFTVPLRKQRRLSARIYAVWIGTLQLE